MFLKMRGLPELVLAFWEQKNRQKRIPRCPRDDTWWCGSFEAIIGNRSTEVNYCQGTVLDAYHSNETNLSGMDGGGWRDFGSLARRKRLLGRRRSRDEVQER